MKYVGGFEVVDVDDLLPKVPAQHARARRRRDAQDLAVILDDDRVPLDEMASGGPPFGHRDGQGGRTDALDLPGLGGGHQLLLTYDVLTYFDNTKPVRG